MEDWSTCRVHWKAVVVVLEGSTDSPAAAVVGCGCKASRRGAVDCTSDRAGWVEAQEAAVAADTEDIVVVGAAVEHRRLAGFGSGCSWLEQPPCHNNTLPLPWVWSKTASTRWIAETLNQMVAVERNQTGITEEG